MCPSTRLVPHRLPTGRIYSKIPANRHLWHVHAGHDVVHEQGLTLMSGACSTGADWVRMVGARWAIRRIEIPHHARRRARS